MATIQPPWPPADPTQPLDAPHDGCCGPIDTCGRYRRIELRYDIIGTRTGGPVGAGWLWIATGQLMVADATVWDWYSARSLGAGPPLVAENILEIDPTHTIPQGMSAQANLSLDILGTIMVAASSTDIADYCGGQFTLPVIQSNGPPDPPDELLVTPLRWYETSTYPYLG